MRKALVLVGLAGCWRSVTDAPPGTPPLIISLPPEPFLVTERIPVGAKWEAGCIETIWSLDLDISTSGDSSDDRRIEDVDISIDKNSSRVSCNVQKFTATASCVPGPCAVISGTRGTSRTLDLAFGASGKHALTLVIDNGSIRKAWTTDVEVIQADALKLGCAAWWSETRVRCDPRVQRVGQAVELSATAFAHGEPIPTATPAIYVDGKRLQGTSFVPEAVGVHVVIARYDGLSAEFALVVEQ